MSTPLVLDTCALTDRSFWPWLKKYHGRKVLPSIAYTEISVYFVGSRNKTQEQVDSMLNGLGITVEWYRHVDARRAVEISLSNGDFSRNWRDYMIASHAYIAPWIVVTKNVKDFEWLGNRVKTPGEAQRAL